MKQTLLSRLASSIGMKNRRVGTDTEYGAHPSRRITQLKRVAIVIVALAGFSLFQFKTTGEVSWLGSLLDGAGSDTANYPTRPEAGWRKAFDAVDSVAAKKEGQGPSGFQLTGRVVRIADGDTISVLDSENQQHKIRFYGIDAPEQGQPHGEAARDALVAWLENRDVGVVIIEKDDYGRTVGTVYLDNRNINLALVEEGHAWWYSYHAPRELHLKHAQEVAFINQKGLWSGASPIPPWDWRRKER
jgi:endonuclease YncB( thermonuclease family)